MGVVRRWAARRHHLCGAANVNTTKSEAIGRLAISQRGPGGRERDHDVRLQGQRIPFHSSKVFLYPLRLNVMVSVQITNGKPPGGGASTDTSCNVR